MHSKNEERDYDTDIIILQLAIYCCPPLNEPTNECKPLPQPPLRATAGAIAPERLVRVAEILFGPSARLEFALEAVAVVAADAVNPAGGGESFMAILEEFFVGDSKNRGC